MKKMIVNCAMCDMRSVTEETLKKAIDEFKKDFND